MIAWLWARTVASPDPMVRGAHVPLVSSRMLSTKPTKQAWVDIILDSTQKDGWSFNASTGFLDREGETKRKLVTKAGKAQDFLCCLSGTPIQRKYIQAEGKAGRLGKRLMAIVVAGPKGRLYISPERPHEQAAQKPESIETASRVRSSFLTGATPTRVMITGGVCSAYGLETWGHIFTARQLVALTTFSDLVAETWERVLADALEVSKEGGPSADWLLQIDRIAYGGKGAQAYADAVATYLGCAVGKAADYWSGICSWDSSRESFRNTFGRQAMPMVWDFLRQTLVPSQQEAGALALIGFGRWLTHCQSLAPKLL